MELNKKELGERIRRARKNKGLSQEELGNLIGVHGNTVSAWENGVFLPKILIMQKLAQALDIPEKDLLTDPPDDSWMLEIKISNKEVIDMTQCEYISNLNLQKNYAALTLGGIYEIFEDDAKFQDFIDHLVRARTKILRLGEDWCNEQ